MTSLPRGLVAVVIFAVGAAVGGVGVWTWDHGLPSPPPPRFWEATVFLPTHDNDGKPFPPERWHDAVDVIVLECGGATVGDPMEGAWADDSRKVQRETVRPVVVSFPRKNLPGFRKAATEAGRRLGQQVVYYRLEEPRIEMLTVDSEKGR